MDADKKENDQVAIRSQRPTFSRQPPKPHSSSQADPNGVAGSSETRFGGAGGPQSWGPKTSETATTMANPGKTATSSPSVPQAAAGSQPPRRPTEGNSLASERGPGLIKASTGSSDTGVSGRLARLAQQRQRLAEQRARLAAGRSGSGQLAAGLAAPPKAQPTAQEPAPVEPGSEAQLPITERGKLDARQQLPSQPSANFVERIGQQAETGRANPTSNGTTAAASRREGHFSGSQAGFSAEDLRAARRKDADGIGTGQREEETTAHDIGTSTAESTGDLAGIPFGGGASAGSDEDFFQGASPAARPVEEGNLKTPPMPVHVAASEIPFGGACAFNTFNEAETGPSFFEGSSQPGELYRPPLSQASSNGACEAMPFRAPQEVRGSDFGRAQNGSYANSSGQASEEWSQKPQWGSNSSLSAAGFARPQFFQPPGSAQPPSRSNHHSRNPSWASSDPISSFSTAAVLPPAHLPLPAWHSQPAQDRAAPAFIQAHQPPQIWGDSADDDGGADFFAASPVGAPQEVNGRVSGLSEGSAAENTQGLPWAEAGGAQSERGSSSHFLGPRASSQPEYVEQTSPFAAETLQRQEFQWEEQQQAAQNHQPESFAPWSSQSATGQPAWVGHQEQPQSFWNANAHPTGSHGLDSSFSSYTAAAPLPSHAGQPGFSHGQWQAYGAATSSWGSQATSAEVPNTAEQARRCPSGRPPVPLLAFGFGGLAVAMRPRQSPVMASGHERGLALGPLELLRAENLAASLDLRSALTEDCVVDRTPQLLRSIPGVLNASTPKNKVLEFVRERESGAGEEGEPSEDAGAVKLLWAVLRLLLQNKGSLKSPPESSRPSKSQQPSTERQLAEMLADEGAAPGAHPPSTSGLENSSGDWRDSRVLSGQSASSSGLEEGAQRMQSLLQRGEQAAALKVAVEAQLWGPALLLAKLSGGHAFEQTASAMTQSYLRPGTPLQTLLSAACPQPETTENESSADVSNWRACLSILALNRGPNSDAALVRLGDRLWAGGQNVAAAHVCYVAAGLAPMAYDSSARFCLPGSDHRERPRTYASVAAIQRGLILELAKLQGQAAAPQSAAAMLPYRLVLAARLAEYGQVEAASQQCGAAAVALNALGGKLPGGLLVVRSLVNELQLRLQTHAQAFNINITHAAGGSLMSKAGQWLDRGLSKLMGVSDLPEGTVQKDGKPPQAQHRRTTSSQPGSPKAQPYRRVSSAAEISRPPAPQILPVPSAPPSAAASPTPSTASQPDRAPSLSVRGLIGKVGSFTSLLGASGPAKREAELGSENLLYYDNDLKMWREHGKPPPEPEAPPAPPPVFPTSHAALAGPSIPSGAQPEGQFPGAQGGGVRSRYVDTIATRQPSGGAIPRPSGGAPLLPKPAFFTPPGGARPMTPSFFTPTACGQPAQPAWQASRQLQAAPGAGAGTPFAPQRPFAAPGTAHRFGSEGRASSAGEGFGEQQDAMTDVAL